MMSLKKHKTPKQTCKKSVAIQFHAICLLVWVVSDSNFQICWRAEAAEQPVNFKISVLDFFDISCVIEDIKDKYRLFVDNLRQ